MYYKRYCQKDLDLAIANESITTEHVARILKFWKNDVFILKGKDSLDALKSVIPNLTHVDRDSEQDLYYVQVTSWPHIKTMCLKFARKNPCRWIYVTQDDDKVLFRYDLDSYNLELTKE